MCLKVIALSSKKKKKKHQRHVLMPGVKCDLFQLDPDQNWEGY